MEARYPGLEHVWFHWPESMPLGEYKEQLHRFAEEVMPAFVSAAATASIAAPGASRPAAGR
jgi:hypothetical protein